MVYWISELNTDSWTNQSVQSNLWTRSTGLFKIINYKDDLIVNWSGSRVQLILTVFISVNTILIKLLCGFNTFLSNLFNYYFNYFSNKVFICVFVHLTVHIRDVHANTHRQRQMVALLIWNSKTTHIFIPLSSSFLSRNAAHCAVRYTSQPPRIPARRELR